jgi:hypothetical protein
LERNRTPVKHATVVSGQLRRQLKARLVGAFVPIKSMRAAPAAV